MSPLGERIAVKETLALGPTLIRRAAETTPLNAYQGEVRRPITGRPTERRQLNSSRRRFFCSTTALACYVIQVPLYCPPGAETSFTDSRAITPGCPLGRLHNPTTPLSFVHYSQAYLLGLPNVLTVPL